MSPLAYFEAAWMRCGHLSAMQAYLAANVVKVLRPEELLRAEWVSRVSALDLYIHELVAQRMLATFEGHLPATSAFGSFMINSESMNRIRHALSPADASASFDLEVRRQLAFVTYQHPDKIADGIRLCSTAELWNDVAVHQGASQQTKVAYAKQLRRQLTSIVDRRNKIAHEGDLQPKTLPIEPWPISQNDLVIVTNFIERLVRSIDASV